MVVKLQFVAYRSASDNFPLMEIKSSDSFRLDFTVSVHVLSGFRANRSTLGQSWEIIRYWPKESINR